MKNIKNKAVNYYYRIFTRCLRAAQRRVGASTIGVRTLVINAQNQILLLHHTYMEDWHFPGGGVNAGEPAMQAAIRELREETGVIATGRLELFGVYFQTVMRVNDYVIFYIVRDFKETNDPISPEIAEFRWFSLENLPPDIDKSTHRRLNEYFQRQFPDERW